MLAILPEYNGDLCDITGEVMTKAVGSFARGATGRVCLVLVQEFVDGMRVNKLEEVRVWAEQDIDGYLDY